jgi:hypothetical protein
MKKEKDRMRILEMHMVLDENGKVRVPPELMEALDIGPGDMLSFHFDESGVHVKGGRRPAYFHAATESPPSTPSIPPKQETTKRGTLPPPIVSLDVTQGAMFGADMPVPKGSKRRPRRR